MNVLRVVLAAALIASVQPIAVNAAPAAPAPCSAPRYHQFDFFLGRWSVTNAAGKLIGLDTVDTQLRGCMIVERYADVGDDGRGYGIMGFRSGTGTWHQTFIDDGGMVLTLDGRIVSGAMVMEGVDYRSTGGKRLHRVSFIPKPGGRVEELWRASVDDGRTWKTVFHGFFTRAETAETSQTAAGVIAVEDHWTRAETHGDAGYVDALLLDDYRSIGPRGAVRPKAAMLASARRNGRSDVMAKRVASYLIAHPFGTQVALHGTTAVVTFYAKKLGPQKGILSCDVFTYVGGRWRAAYSQHTSAPA